MMPDDLELVPDDLEMVPDDLEMAPADNDDGQVHMRYTPEPPGTAQQLGTAFKNFGKDAIAAVPGLPQLSGLAGATSQALNGEGNFGDNYRQARDYAQKYYETGNPWYLKLAAGIVPAIAGSAALPGKAAALAQGAGAAMLQSPADYTKMGGGDLAMQAAKDAGTGALVTSAFMRAPDAAMAVGRSAGKGMSKLAELLGYKAGAAPAAANAADDIGARAAQFADVADDVTAANPMPQRVADMPEEALMSRVRQQGQGNVRPGDWQPVPTDRRADMEALQRLIAQGDEAAKASRTAQIKQINDEIGTRNVRRGSVESQAPRDTDVMSLYDAMHMDDLATVDHPNTAWPGDKGPIVSGYADEFGKRRPPSAIDVASKIADMPPAGTPQVAKAPVSTMDAKRQAIIDAQQANPEALAAFGVDPKNGERGFLDLGAGMLAAEAAKYGAKKAGQAAAPYIGQAGAALTKAATPEAAAQRAISDPGVLFNLAKDRGALGGAARAMLQAVQQGDSKQIKARAALLSTMPEWRQRFAPGTDEQVPSMSAASGY